MTVQIWDTISIIGFILGGLMLVVAGLLFWRYQIPRLIGDITGKTAKKAIEDIKKQSEETGRAYKAPSRNAGEQQQNIVSLSGSLVGRTDVLPENAPVAIPQETQEDYGAVNETSLLSNVVYNTVETAPIPDIPLNITVVTDITFIHTNEAIA